MKAYKGGKTSGKKENPDPNILRIVQQYEKTREIIVRNEAEHKYSAMLLELIKPYQSPRPDVDEVDDLLYLAMNAWNIANIKKQLPFAHQMMLQEIKNDLKGDKEAEKLFNQMIRDKERKFGAFDLFIVEYELKPGAGYDAIVNTKAGTLETFLSAILQEEEEDEEEGFDFEPAYIDRSAIMVTPREPFVEWVKKTGGSGTVSEEKPEPNIYLVEEKYSHVEIEAWLEKNFDRVFTKELENWYTDKKSWPKKRTYLMFRQWFDVSFHDSVYDFESVPVYKDVP